MWKDPIVEEIRAIREQHAAQFNYDPALIANDLLQSQERAKLQGRKFVSFPPRRPEGWIESNTAALAPQALH